MESTESKLDALYASVLLLHKKIDSFAPRTDEKRYLTRRETCDALKINLVTLNKHLQNGTIPCKRVGRRVLIPADAI